MWPRGQKRVTGREHSIRTTTGGLRRVLSSVSASLPGWSLLIAGLLCAVWGCWEGSLPREVIAATTSAASAAMEDPDATCARCHRKIYESYERTAMARGSGLATPGLIPGKFVHEGSGVTYRVFGRDGRSWMSFDRPSGSSAGQLHGERELAYYVGSGTHGRTYLYQLDDAWFQLPVNYYRRRGEWAMAPGFNTSTTMPAPLPVDPNCLHCHATQIETSLPQAPHRFPRRPFDQAGIGCSACHGDGTLHVASGGKGSIVNADKLSAVVRDSACIQCHLEGKAVVYKPGRSLAQFRPGDRLSDFAVYFVRSSQADGGRRASSQYEALLLSACKRASGDRLTCTTCHDPHSEPPPAERVAFYRARCLACHNSPALATSHHPDQPDCARCHMPSRSAFDISHEQVTDHDIERKPSKENQKPRAIDELVPVGGEKVGDRELGLAYAQLAQRGDQRAGERAMRLLLRAERAGDADEQVHVNLGFLEQISKNLSAADDEYAAALQDNPYNPTALTNRAVLEAGQGDLRGAVQLLQRLITADPSQTRAGLDLVLIRCQLGQLQELPEFLERLQESNPDFEPLRTLRDTSRPRDQGCPAAGGAGHPSGRAARQ